MINFKQYIAEDKAGSSLADKSKKSGIYRMHEQSDYSK